MCERNQLWTEDMKEFDRLINDVMDINCCNDQDGHTPLMLLFKHRNADSILKDVEILLTKRKDVKKTGINGKSAIKIIRGRNDLPPETKDQISDWLIDGI